MIEVFPSPFLEDSTMNDVNWHSLDVSEALKALESDPHRGLSDDEVARRLAAHGPNELM